MEMRPWECQWGREDLQSVNGTFDAELEAVDVAEIRELLVQPESVSISRPSASLTNASCCPDLYSRKPLKELCSLL